MYYLVDNGITTSSLGNRKKKSRDNSKMGWGIRWQELTWIRLLLEHCFLYMLDFIEQGQKQWQKCLEEVSLNFPDY